MKWSSGAAPGSVQTKLYIPSTLNIDLILWHCVCSKMLNLRLFLSLFKLIPCPIHWIVCVLAYLNLIFEFKAVLVLPKTADSAQTHKSRSFIWIVWSTLYVYLWSIAALHFLLIYKTLRWLGLILEPDISSGDISEQTFPHGDFFAQEYFGIGIFRHHGHFGTKMLQHWDI